MLSFSIIDRRTRQSSRLHLDNSTASPSFLYTIGTPNELPREQQAKKIIREKIGHGKIHLKKRGSVTTLNDVLRGAASHAKERRLILSPIDTLNVRTGQDPV